MTKLRSLNIQTIALVVGNTTAQILVSILYILTAREMQPEQYGPIVTAIALGAAAAGFADLGANAYWIRELASQRMARADFSIRAMIRFVAVLTVAAIVLAVTMIGAPSFAAVGVLLLTTCTSQTVLVPLRAAQRAESVGWLTVLGRVIAIFIFLIQAAFEVDAGTALWTSLALGDLALTCGALLVTPPSNRIKFAIRPLRNPWSGTKWYALTALSTSAQQLDLPLVAAFAGPTAAGTYGAVNRWTQPWLVLIGAFTTAISPFVAAAPRFSDIRGQLMRASWVLIAPIALSVVVFATAPWLVTTLLGDQFEDAAGVLRVLAAAMLLNTFTQPLIAVLQAKRFDHLAAAIVAAAVVTQLAAVAVLAPTLGALGAGIGVLVAQVVAAAGTIGCAAVILRRRRG